jgi:hypothetical protein
LDGISSASAYSPIVPSLDLLWRSDFAGASGLDPRVIPQTTVTSHQGTCTTSYFRENRTLRTSEDDSAETLDSELRQRLHEELASDYACLDNSAAADQHWNTLKAIQVANSFGRWAGLGEALSMPSLYHNLLSSAQHLRCNSAGRFTLIDVAFSDVLRHYNLGQSSQSEEELWDFCSLPLLFVDQLERCYSQRQAQKIALGILTL